jgi:hypothetical protein
MSPRKVDTLERGNVYFFFFQPKVEEAAPQRPEPTRRISMVLSPEQSDWYRLLVVARQQIGEDKDWGFVDAVSNEPKNIEDRLAPEAYPTKTRGESHFSALRSIGKGVYRIIGHNDHTHFVYALELPKVTGGAQPPFDLGNQGSYILSIKNPEKGSPVATDLEQPVDLPGRLQEKFRDRRFCEADPPDFLNYAGVEFVMISADEKLIAENIMEELGFSLQTEDESLTSADILQELRMERSVYPSKTLFKR